jgi:RNA polymerase sigma-70 factor (ECF subfamily)
MAMILTLAAKRLPASSPARPDRAGVRSECRDATSTAEVRDGAERDRVEMDVEQLYRRYGDMVLGRCRSLLGNEADAQEACQEVFLRLFRYRSGFRGDASPTTYLFRVTTTTCLNWRRTRRRRREEITEDFPTVGVEDSVIASHHVRDLVQRVLEEADERTRLAIIYHFVDGMTYQETGELLGLSAAAVRKRVSTFRAKLRDNPPAWLEEVSP